MLSDFKSTSSNVWLLLFANMSSDGGMVDRFSSVNVEEKNLLNSSAISDLSSTIVPLSLVNVPILDFVLVLLRTYAKNDFLSSLVYVLPVLPQILFWPS